MSSMDKLKLQGEPASPVSILLDQATSTEAKVQVVRTVWYHTKTLFLFTKSDFKTVILPQSVFALVMALSGAGSILAPGKGPQEIVMRIPYMLFWLWLHLLVENIANQRMAEGILEDKENKPWRPIPAGRITPSEAESLLRTIVPLAVGTGLLFGSFVPSVALMTFIWMYNDLNGSSTGPVLRNIITTAGLSCFGWGAVATLLSGEITPGGEHLLRNWMLIMALMMITTVQAQDFPDTAGDIARGRKTIPLLYGFNFARRSLAALAIVWSIVCPAFWDVVPLAWLAPVGIGGAMAGLTLLRWDQSSNERVWQLWCLWQTAIYLLPLFSRATV
ncbi:UbiA prenyltransferase family-domain-containing protein [Hypomontagnella monticulosa]|nr:UbiA prenyltransferase family-domain-containing protein [Hypomontagnella monticulosa]